MCQAPVGKVISFDKTSITIDYSGNTRTLKSKHLDVKKGDYVLFSLDIAIDKVDEEEAMAIMGNMK